MKVEIGTIVVPGADPSERNEATFYKDEPGNDMVNHPSHYNQGKIETIDFIEDQKFDFHIGTAIRYLCRAGHKWNEKEDLEKAVWYIQRKIDLLSAAQTEE